MPNRIWVPSPSALLEDVHGDIQGVLLDVSKGEAVCWHVSDDDDVRNHNRIYNRTKERHMNRASHQVQVKHILPGWINVDIFSNVKADIYSSALALPYPAENFDLIYASHVLEHFNRHMVLAALTHWRHLLKFGGIFRLAYSGF